MTNQVSSPNDHVQKWLTAEQPAPLLLTSPDHMALEQAVAEAVQELHPGDLVEVRAIKKTISIKDVRAALSASAKGAWGPFRIIVIYDAERLSLPAANALLKALEESSRSTRFILTTRWRGRLLPTILSRCQHQRVSAVITTPAAEKTALPTRLLQRLAQFRQNSVLDSELLDEVGASLSGQLRERGPTPQLYRAFLRLRDYYKITSTPGGNDKMARDVLLASLPEGRQDTQRS